jgi:hypothetical protein
MKLPEDWYDFDDAALSGPWTPFPWDDESVYPPPDPGEEDLPEEELPPPPPWLLEFAEQVSRSGCIVVGDVPQGASLGMQSAEREGYTECLLSLQRGEFVNGPRAGARVTRKFSLLVEKLEAIFDEVDGACWCPFGDSAEPDLDHFRVSGTYRGHRLVLRWLREPPEDDEDFDRLSAQPS